MILELVEFNSPEGWSRQQVAEEARNVIPKWRANKEMLRAQRPPASSVRNAAALTTAMSIADRGVKRS